MYIKLEKGRPESPVHAVWGLLALSSICAVFIIQKYFTMPLECYFKSATGIPCLTCGATRSIVALSRLQVADSFLFNPLVMTSLFALIVISIFILGGIIISRRLDIKLSAVEARFLRILIAAIIAINWIYLIISQK